MLKVIAFFSRSTHRFPLHLAVVVLIGAEAWAQDAPPPPPAPAYPTDWVVNGQPLHHVKVLEAGPDFVSITDDEGGGQVALSSVTPELQKLFNYPHPPLEGTTAHGIRYKDTVVGLGEPAAKGDLITFNLTGKTHVTVQALKDVATVRQGVLQAQKTTLDTAVTTAQTKYQATLAQTDANAQVAAYNDVQAAQKQVADVEQQIAALQSNTYTIPFGEKDLLPNLTELLAGMKAGGKREIVPPAPPKLSTYEAPITIGGPSPTPSPTPKPDLTPPPLDYQVEVTDIEHADAQP